MTRSFKVPPTTCKLAADAICLIFAKKPSWDNFQKLAAEPDFLSKKIPNYDMNYTSEYVTNELKKFIDKPEFSRESILSTNHTMAYLGTWATIVYEYAVLNEKVILIENLSLNRLNIYLFLFS